MSDELSLDLIDAISEWTERGDEPLDDGDIDAILRIQIAIDDSEWTDRTIGELSAADIVDVKADLADVDAPDFVAWVIDETLALFGVTPESDDAHSAPAATAVAPLEDANKDSDDGDAEALDTEEAVATGADEPDEEPLAEDEELDVEATEEDEASDEATDEADAEPDVEELTTAPDDASGGTGDEAEADPRASDDASHPEIDGAPETANNDDGQPEVASDEDEAPDAVEEPDDTDPWADDSEEVEASVDRRPSAFEIAVAGEEPTAVGAGQGGAFSGVASGGAFASTIDAAANDHSSDAVAADFFAELDRSTTSSVTEPIELELGEGPDALGPTFLPPPTGLSQRRRAGLAVLTVAAVVLFLLAGIQLVSNVDEPDEEPVAAETDEASDGSSDAASEPTDNSEGSDAQDSGSGEENAAEVDPAQTAEPDDLGAAPTATSIPRATTDSTALLLTESGDVWSIDIVEGEAMDARQIHDSEANPPATDLSFLDSGAHVGVVDSAGDAYVVDLDDPTSRALVWAADRVGPATTLLDAGNSYGVLDRSGSVSFFSKSRPASAFSVDTVWSSSAGATPPARSIASHADLVPFVIGNGDVRMAVTSGDEIAVVTIWDSQAQPDAFNLTMDGRGLLMGIGAGAVARYQWFEEAPPLSAVWDPLDGSRLPAIGYAALGDGATAVVLNNGSVARVDAAGGGDIVWDAEVADLRAIATTSSELELLVMLEGGSIIRVDSAAETEGLGTIWDSERSAAVKMMVRDS